MKSFRLENRERDKKILPALKSGPTKADPLERDQEHDVILGDAQDTDEFVALKGATRNPRCPSPVVIVTEAQLGRLAPAARKALEFWTSGPRPQVVMTEIPG